MTRTTSGSRRNMRSGMKEAWHTSSPRKGTGGTVMMQRRSSNREAGSVAPTVTSSGQGGNRLG
jgi:hypothetical protein